MPIIAIVGRPNVGKSTLFNRLTGKRHALVSDTPGLTRDWREGEGSIGPLEFGVLDTAGWEYAKSGSLSSRMVGQTRQAIEKADALLFLLDARDGITSVDRDIARELRKGGKPISVALNKAEGKIPEGIEDDVTALGFGAPALISAEHNEGMAELYEVIEAMIRLSDDPKPESSDHPIIGSSIIQMALVGQPNAGKSTLMNTLLGEERTLTGPEAGITRDSIAADFTYKDQAIKLVDTAGMRKKSKVQEKIEKMAVEDTLHTIQFAHVVVVLMDAECPLEKQDLTIASLIEREGRALIIALNKWDTVTAKDEYLTAFRRELAHLIPQAQSVPIVPVSALKNTGINKLLDAALKAYELWNTKLSTSKLNKWLEFALTRHHPPSVKNRRLKFRYITQTKTRPPSFQLFCNMGVKDVPESYIRYLTHSLREAFDLPGVPIRLILRKPKNPFSE